MCEGTSIYYVYTEGRGLCVQLDLIWTRRVENRFFIPKSVFFGIFLFHIQGRVTIFFRLKQKYLYNLKTAFGKIARNIWGSIGL